jgi:leucyl aminopeptidase
MKASILLSVSIASFVAAITHPKDPQIPIQDLQPPATEPELYLIELAPGETRYVTEDDKWALRLDGINFFDITETPELGALNREIGVKSVSFPKKTAHNESIAPLLKKLEKKNMRKHLEKFTSFHTRYYKSSTGAESSAWLLSQVNNTLSEAGALEHGASVKAFPHSWGQASIIATIPGKSEKTVVIGAHQDSINLFFPSLLAAPGADDDGSGTVTILEALRVLLQSEDIVKGKANNTVEFHWYSAEEGGLLGSQAIFQSYEKAGRDVKAMLQQDMTGYVQKTLDAGEPESVGVITDYVDVRKNPWYTLYVKTSADFVSRSSGRSHRVHQASHNRLLRHPLRAHKVRLRLFCT